MRAYAFRNWRDPKPPPAAAEPSPDFTFLEEAAPPPPEPEPPRPQAMAPRTWRSYLRSIRKRRALSYALVGIMVTGALVFGWYKTQPLRDRLRLLVLGAQRNAVAFTKPLVLTTGQVYPMNRVRDFLEDGGYEEASSQNDSRPGLYRVVGTNILEVYPGQRDVDKFSAVRIIYGPDGATIVKLYTLLPAFDEVPRVQIPPLAVPLYSRDDARGGGLYVSLPRDRSYLERSGIFACITALEDHRRTSLYRRVIAVDVIAALGSVFRNARRGRITGGASTLEMQLARMVDPTLRVEDKSYTRKIREVWLAEKIRLSMKNEEILEAYANHAPLGAAGGVQIRGFEAAARAFFGKPLITLDWSQKAWLVSMLPAPSRHSPLRSRSAEESLRVNRRYRAMITKLAERRVLSEEEAEHARENVPVPDSRLWDPVFGSPVEVLQADLRRFAADGEAINGIQTSIDPSTQRALHSAIILELNRLESELGISLQTAGIVLENATGRILAIVTNREAAGPNTINLAAARHQMGSLVKPFIVVSLAEDGTATPATTYRDDGEVIVDMPHGPHWIVHNNGDYIPAREVTMYDALARSLNVWFVGVSANHYAKVTDSLTRLFHFAPPLPSHLLGTGEVSLLEVASAYAMLTTEGWRIEPHVVTSAIATDGKHLVPEFGRQQIVGDSRAAYIGLRSLTFAVDSPTGTPHALRQRAELAPFPNLGAKTGTTSNGHDAWAVAVTPRITCVVWFGSNGSDRLYSSTSALKAVEEVLVRLAGSRREFLDGTFVKPADIVDAMICVQDGQLAGKNCPENASWPFLAGTAPTDHCSHS